MADKILGFAVKGVASGIGLAAESVHHYNEKKRERNLEKSVTPSQEKSSHDATSAEVQAHDAGPLQQEEDDEKHRGLDEEHWELDEEHWELDEAQDTFQAQTSHEEKKKHTRDLNVIIMQFVSKYPTPPPAYDEKVGIPRLLALPVILPQRRPKDRSRGFIRAYAPVLKDCGIDQAMFLDFLETFNEATEASPWINAINFAGIAGFFVAAPISIAITVAIQISMKIAREVDSRKRTNDFLDHINRAVFQPRGLYALVLTWNPDSGASHTEINVTSTIASSMSASSTGAGAMDKMKHKFQTSSGNTYGDFEFPQAAPLVFPALDKLADQKGEEAHKIMNQLKGAQRFVADYMDRRARATYAGEHPNSLLSQQAPKDKFTSRYADPNNPASNGSLISLVTGGHINPPQLERGYGGGFGGGFGRGGGVGGIIEARREMMMERRDMMMQRRLGGGWGGRGVGGIIEARREMMMERRLGGGWGGRGRLGMGGGVRAIIEARREMMVERELGGGWGGRGSMGMGGRMSEEEYNEEAYDMQEGGRGRGYYEDFAGRGGDYGRGGEFAGRGMGGLGVGPGGVGFGGLDTILGLGGAGIKKILGRNILYLMIVNMPTEEDMAAANEQSKEFWDSQ